MPPNPPINKFTAELGQHLRELRKQTGLSGELLADRLGWRTRSKISKLERGQQMASDQDLREWAEACGSPGSLPRLQELLILAGETKRELDEEVHESHAALQKKYDELVRGANRIRNFEITLIPGLLQTADYARYRVLEAVRLKGTSEDEVEATVAARMRRQEVLWDTTKTFEFVICEAALRYLLCPPQAMAVQWDRLLSVFGLSHVTFGIIPPGVELNIAPMVGFITADDQTFLETFTTDYRYAGPKSEKHDHAMDLLMAEAVTGDEARRLIVAAAADLRGEV